MMNHTMKLAYSLEHGDWYKDQRNHNKDNYRKFEVWVRDDNRLDVESITLYGSLGMSFKTPEEAISWLASKVDLTPWHLEDYKVDMGPAYKAWLALW